jgi:hypothetical protein
MQQAVTDSKNKMYIASEGIVTGSSKNGMKRK